MICQAVLEHVHDVQSALVSISSILETGGFALIFVPSRNAIYARLNRILPDNLKRQLLYFIHPQTKEGQGFTSYYDRCTPMEFRKMAEKAGLRVSELRTYYVSTYFTFFFPIHLLWRIWIILLKTFAGEQAAETFALVLRKV